MEKQETINGIEADELWENLLYEDNNGEDVFVWKKHENLGYPPRFHSSTEIYFVLEGDMEAEIKGETLKLSAGDIIVVNPFEIHMYTVTGDAYVGVLIFNDSYLSDFKLAYGNKIFPTHLTNKEYNAEILRILDDVPPSFSVNKSLSLLAKKAYVNLVLDKIITKYGLLEAHESSNEIIEVVNYIFQNSAGKITLDSLAKKFNYSKTSISRMMTKYLKTDLRRFVNDIRAEHVKTLLTDPNYSKSSVLEIASICGFDSVATFYRAYKRRFGTLPERPGRFQPQQPDA